MSLARILFIFFCLAAFSCQQRYAHRAKVNMPSTQKEAKANIHPVKELGANSVPMDSAQDLEIITALIEADTLPALSTVANGQEKGLSQKKEKTKI